jgi:hypothetical protein
MKHSWISLVVMIAVANCYTAQDIHNAECAVACRREGYTGGYWIEKTNSCACADVFGYERMTKKKLKVGSEPIRPLGGFSVGDGEGAPIQHPVDDSPAPEHFDLDF